ncbi:hypothetical protein FEM03_05765 [Phragmitibacter flavus]|uniref:Uncharacterized protein n=1 Tax=Phragmitibacter flavus TaxID=2576071 RepID=A0A5R8KI32_9BACT|nr:hypothetical protein [Phragmitibacter flavus]TLD71645.1 hypothetical protein FEM03_05765 [Phragmitibacter flavus]
MANLFRWLANVPFKLHWFFVLFLAFVLPWATRKTPNPGEWFPFSNFPMYSNFAETAYYVFISDLDDNPLPMAGLFAVPSGVKKAYDQKLKERVEELKDEAKSRGERYRKRIVQMDGEECRPAGDATLQQLLDSRRDKGPLAGYAGFRLYQVDITLDDEGQIVKRTKLVGEVRQ